VNAVVIVGGGHGGVQVAASLRDEGFENDIILLESQQRLPYQRPPLSKQYMTGEHDEAGLVLRGESFFASRKIDLRLGTTVNAIDRDARVVHVDSGARVRYGHLVLAPGAASRPLAVPGANLEGVLSLRTFDDALLLRHRLESAKNVVVVGGGFIGLEIAAVASAAARVCIVEPRDRVLARAVTPTVSEVVESSHACAGNTLLLGSAVVELTGRNNAVCGAVLSDGTTLPADLVVIGVGALPATGLAAASGLTTNGGIVVDEFLTTSDKYISAIGDCVSRIDERGHAHRIECVQNAVDQARYVAQRLVTGRPEPFAAIPFFWTNQLDLRIQTVGTGWPDDDQLVLGDREQNTFSVCRFHNDHLVAVESVNRPRDHMAARKLLGGHQRIDLATASHPGFDLKTYLMSRS
jgi:3-phenylpropionate/trans-cinnamate dioxygenase ferredoxin reductase component